jgi:hypothetical protein
VDTPNAERASDEVTEALGYWAPVLEEANVVPPVPLGERPALFGKLEAKLPARLRPAFHSREFKNLSKPVLDGPPPAVPGTPAATKPTLVPQLQQQPQQQPKRGLTPGEQKEIVEQLLLKVKKRGIQLADAGREVLVSIFGEIRADAPHLKAVCDLLEPKYLAQAEAKAKAKAAAAPNPGPPAASPPSVAPEPTQPPAASPPDTAQTADEAKLLRAVQEHGWQVVLLAPRSKAPVGKNWQVTQDAHVITDHLKSGGNVGVVCGPESGVMVLDFDDLGAAREMIEHISPLPLMVETGSGKWHVYVRHETGMPAKIIWNGKTIGEVQRGPNQQVVCPPSTHPVTGRAYTWVGDPAGDLRALPGEWRLYLDKPQRQGQAADQGVVARALKQPGAKRRTQGVKFRCPACASEGHDKSMDNAILFFEGGYGCARAQGTEAEAEHRKAIGEALGAGRGQARQLVVTLASEYKPRAAEWLWKDRIPLGMLSLLGGREGTGKSTLIYERAARVTRGDLDGPVKPRNVIVVATEDSWAHTITPRLIAAGADLDRVMNVKVVVKDLGTYELSLPDDISALQQLVAKSDVALVILDPVISRLSRRIDTHLDAEVKLGLEPLAKMADEARVAIVGLIHVNKSDSKDPLTMIMASRAFVATARAVLFVNRDPEGGSKRILGQPKNNVGPDDNTGLLSLTFDIKPVTLEGYKDPVTGEPINTTRVVWTGTTTRTTRDIIVQAAKGVTKRSKAVDWLAKFLGTRTVPIAEVIKAGVKAGFDEDGRLLRDAAEELGVKRERSGFPATGTWSLEL